MKSYFTFGLAALFALAFFSPPAFAGDGNWRSGNRDGGRRHYRDNNPIVITQDNPVPNYNNSNYLGYPPWYRLNYYAPWMSDYRNGTAWTNIPSSHAAEGYGMPSCCNTMPSGYYKWLAANGCGAPAACGGMPTPYLANGGAPELVTPEAGYAMASPSVRLAGNDIVVVVQRELRRKGFYGGLINGVSDCNTRTAIRAYESSAGLPATGGVIGIDLLRSLGLLQ